MSAGNESDHTRFIRVGLSPPLRYFDFNHLLDAINVDRPRRFDQEEVLRAFEIIRETRTDSGAQRVAIEEMIKDESTPLWRHVMRTAGTQRVIGGLVVTVASGVDAAVSGGLVSIAIATAGGGVSIWGLLPIRHGAKRIQTAKQDLALYETYIGKSEAARDRMIQLGYAD